MKKTIIFLFLAVMLGCSKEDQDCRCDVEIIVTNTEGRYTITNVTSDCNGNVDVNILDLPANHWFARTKNCD